MKRLVVGIIVLAISLIAAAQTSHQVSRGETPESIASKYGLTLPELQKANPALQRGCHVGMTLSIPLSETAMQAKLAQLMAPYEEAERYWNMGNEAMAEDRYAAAESCYSRALVVYDNEPSLYYNRGLSFFYRDKYNKALADFQHCVSMGSARDDISEKASQMITRCNQAIEEKSTRTKEVIGSVALALAGTALVVGGAALASGLPAPASPPYAAMSPYGAYAHYDYGDAYTQSQLASDRAQIYANSAMGVSMARQQQARLNQEFQQYNDRQVEKVKISSDFNSPFNQVFVPLCRELDQNPLMLNNAHVRFKNMYREKFGRETTFLEDELFNESLNAYVASRAKAYGETDESSDEDFKIPSSGNYQAEYAELENRVKAKFDTWSHIGGVKSTGSDGKPKFSANSANPAGTNTKMFSQVRQLQKEMKRTRLEAKKHGITIAKSDWETLNPAYYYDN